MGNKMSFCQMLFENCPEPLAAHELGGILFLVMFVVGLLAAVILFVTRDKT